MSFPRPLFDARAEAAALLARARTEAEALRAEAAGAVREAARREGFETGRADGVAEAAVALAAARARGGAPASRPRLRRRSRWRRRWPKGSSGARWRWRPRPWRRSPAKRWPPAGPARGTVRVRIHPDDLPAVEARRAALEARAPAAALELVADEAVGRHGCVIETPQGRVDARLETQLAALERALTAREAPVAERRSIWDRRWRGSRARRRAANRDA